MFMKLASRVLMVGEANHNNSQFEYNLNFKIVNFDHKIPSSLFLLISLLISFYLIAV